MAHVRDSGRVRVKGTTERRARRAVGRSLTGLLLVALVLLLGAPSVAVTAGPRDRGDRDRGGQGGDESAAEIAAPDAGPAGDGADGDADYFPDIIDNCPGVPNADQRDADGDGVGDACQRDAAAEAEDAAAASDVDGDGIRDARDNCPEVANGGQGDADGDGRGNQCDGTPNGEAPPEPDLEPQSEADSPPDAPPAEDPIEDGGDRTDNGNANRDENRGERDDRGDTVSAAQTAEDEGGGGGENEGGRDGDGTSRGDGDRDAADRASAPPRREGDIPVLAPAPRPPAGPPPAVTSFTVPKSSWRPIIAIDTGALSAADTEAAGERAGERTRERRRERAETPGADRPPPASDNENRSRKPDRAEPGTTGETERATGRPVADRTDGDPSAADRGEGASRRRTTETFVDREESLIREAIGDPGRDQEPTADEAEPSADEAALDDERSRERGAARRSWSLAGLAQADPEEGDDTPFARIAAPPERDDDAPSAATDRRDAGVRDGGAEWRRDEFFDGGSARGRPEVTRILGTDRDELYLSQRIGRGDEASFSYAIPMPDDGTYLVRLHFAEIYWGATGGPDASAGQRVFSVDAERRPALTDYDIAADVGSMTAVVKEFEVDVDDGRLDLEFSASRDQPAVAGIEILGEPTGERWVDVDKASDTVRLMIGDTAVARYQASMSVGPEDDFHDTMPGTYQIQSKIAELTWTPYAQNYFMYWAGFDPGRENGFHSWVMDDKGRVVPNGDGPTWGCVATAPDDAAEIYGFVDIGTRVEVHW